MVPPLTQSSALPGRRLQRNGSNPARSNDIWIAHVLGAPRFSPYLLLSNQILNVVNDLIRRVIAHIRDANKIKPFAVPAADSSSTNRPILFGNRLPALRPHKE